MNTLTLVGNLVAEPELRYINSGAAVVNFTVAHTPRIYNKATNEWTDGEALFMRCNLWRDAAENVAESLHKGNRVIVTGSGGSNRLRGAILQTLSNLVDFGMSVEQAVRAPRIHLEADLLSLEPGLPEAGLAALRETYPRHQLWDQPNLFFGGCHSLSYDGIKLEGAGDPRRGGCFLRSIP